MNIILSKQFWCFRREQAIVGEDCEIFGVGTMVFSQTNMKVISADKGTGGHKDDAVRAPPAKPLAFHS